MRIPIRVVILVVLAVPCSLRAQNCENVIALSKTVSTVVQDRDTVEKHAANFCSEYAKNQGSSSSSSFGASVKFLTAASGSSDASFEAIASRYCSASDVSVARSDSYRQYVETIAPNAYSAYEQCAKSNDLHCNLDLATVLPTEFSLGVSYIATSRGAKADVTYTASSGVSCKWSGDPKVTNRVLESGSTDFLNCSRSNQAKRSYVRIANLATGIDNVMTIPWQAYSADDVPIDAITALQAELKSLGGRVTVLEPLVTSLKTTVEDLDVDRSVWIATNNRSNWGDVAGPGGGQNGALSVGQTAICGSGRFMVGMRYLSGTMASSAFQIVCAQGAYATKEP